MATTDRNPVANDEAEIRQLIERWSAAVRDENLEEIRADHDSDILMFDVPPPLQVDGLDAYMATWRTFFSWSVRPITFEFHDTKVFAGADVAFATAIGRCSGQQRDGEIEHLEFRLTMGFCKRNGRWRIVHEHHSVPATD